MSGMLWQDIAVAVIVASALGWLVARRLRRRGKPAAACENCPSAAPMPAGVRPAPMPEVLLSIGEPPPRRNA
jgi:hypothetical protein